MELERLNRWLELAANLGVLAGIVFLVVEMNQSNRIAVASSEIEIRANYGMLNELVIADAELAHLFVEAQSEDAKLSADEQHRLLIWLTQLANQWLAIETAFENEMIPEETFQVMFDDQRNIIGRYPALRPLLRQVVDTYQALSTSHAFISANKLLREHSI